MSSRCVKVTESHLNYLYYCYTRKMTRLYCAYSRIFLFTRITSIFRVKFGEYVIKRDTEKSITLYLFPLIIPLITSAEVIFLLRCFIKLLLKDPSILISGGN